MEEQNKRFSKSFLIAMVGLSLMTSACATYWTKEGADIQETAKDLHDCRVQANQKN